MRFIRRINEGDIAISIAEEEENASEKR